MNAIKSQFRKKQEIIIRIQIKNMYTSIELILIFTGTKIFIHRIDKYTAKRTHIHMYC